MAASTNTVTVVNISDTFKRLDINFQAQAGDPELTAETTNLLAGRQIVSVVTTGGTTGPTADSDLEIKDVFSQHLFIDSTSNGANVVGSNDAVNHVLLETGSLGYVYGGITVTITNNAVNQAETTVSIFYKETI